ncbi:Ig-like domain repeat protein, partial [bacterium]|nr:Ig-like domain repeat protein [bacterium]
FGTINVLGSVTPSSGMQLAVNSTGLTGYWAGALNSGSIPVTQTETNLGKLTLAFDLRTSAVRQIRVRLESADAGGVVGGTLEKMIYPAVSGSFQRYAFELSTMTAAGGTFSPTAPNVKLTWQIEGGVDAGSWPAGVHSLHVDNVYYAKPAYYVKPGGAGSQNGLTEANAFSSIASALTAATNAGDIIVIMESGSPSYNLASGLAFSGGGTPGGWVTLKNYPGHSPLIKRLEPTSGSYDTIVVGKISGTVEYVKNYNYIEIRGLRWTGTADTLAVADRGGSTAKSNLNGLSAAGRATIKAPHHIRFADNEIYNISAGGISGIDIDWWYVENNDIHDTSNWTIYGTSGISQLTPSTFDGTAGTYRTFWLGNKSYRNETKIAWAQIGQISDGNGAILDTFITTRHGPYLGRSIVANNQFYENGGSGVHTLYVNGADIINNTVVRNSHSPALTYSNIFAVSSNDIVIANNIIVASAGEPINNASYSTSFPETTGVAFLNNLYLSDDSTNLPYVGPDDSGNITTTDVGFVNDAVGTNDYRLRSGSPAFDAALASAVGLPIRDFYGILRKTDGLPDIGACERQPAIVSAPLTQSVAAGGAVTLSVVAKTAGANSALAYQWQRNGVNVAGATNSSLALTGVSLAQAGDYRAVVSVGSPAFDTVTSALGTLSLQTPYPTATALTASANPANFNASVTFTATVTSAAGIPAGIVTFFDGVTTLGTGTLNGSGVATLALSNLAGGGHSVTASYGAASNYAASTSSAISQTIQPIASATALTSSANPAAFGAIVTFTATVTSSSGAPAGSVTFKDGAATLGSGTLNGAGLATFSSSSLSGGSHSVTAVYGGGANHLSSTSSAVSQIIQALATSTALSSNANPANFGANVTFTATVTNGSSIPAGTVSFKDGAATLGTGTLNGAGVATFSSSSLSAGSHSITAVYGGNANHLTSTSSAVSQAILPLATITTLASETNPSSPATAVSLTATVTAASGIPSGTVTFLDGVDILGSATLDAGGEAVLTTSALASGSHPLTASFSASGNFAASVSAVLNQAIRHTTTIDLVSNINPAPDGTPVTFTATVSSSLAGATGLVTFSEGGATLGTAVLDGSGIAVLTTSTLAVGSHPVTAAYAGDATHDGSVSSQLVEIIQAAITPYEAWQAAFFSPADLADEARSSPNADPDGDGYQNLMEYAFNTDPLLAGNAGMPIVSRDGDGLLRISFQRLREDLTYIVEGSGDLSAWSAIATNPGSVGQSVVVADTAPSGAPLRMLRLHVIR